MGSGTDGKPACALKSPTNKVHKYRVSHFEMCLLN